MSTKHIRSVVQKNNTVRNLSRNYTSTITNQCGRNHVLASCRSDVHECLALQEQVLDLSSPKESKLAFDVDGVRVGNPPWLPLSLVSRDNVALTTTPRTQNFDGPLLRTLTHNSTVIAPRVPSWSQNHTDDTPTHPTGSGYQGRTQFRRTYRILRCNPPYIDQSFPFWWTWWVIPL